MRRLQPYEVFDRISIGEGMCDVCGGEGRVLALPLFWDERREFSTGLCAGCLHEAQARLQVGNNRTRRELGEDKAAEDEAGRARLREYEVAARALTLPPPYLCHVDLEVARWGGQPWGRRERQVVGTEKAELRLFTVAGGVCLEVLRGGQRFVGAMFTPAQAERLVARCREQLRAGDRELYFGVICPRCIGMEVVFTPLWENGLKIAFYTPEKVAREYRFAVGPELLARLTRVTRVGRQEWDGLGDSYEEWERQQKLEAGKVREQWID